MESNITVARICDEYGPLAKDSLIKPLLKIWRRVHEKTSEWMWRSMVSFNGLFCGCLCWCGLSFILVPLHIAYAGIFLCIEAVIAVFYALIGLTLGIIFTMVGILPAFILAIGITGITVFTLPMNIYYHALITYRYVHLFPPLGDFR